MAWAFLDDKRHENPKILAAGLEANGLDANAITYCAAHETDGFVPDVALPALALGARKPSAVADRLVAVGRWARDEERGGWVIHDYLRFQLSHAKAEAKRAAAAARQRNKRARDSNGRYTTGGPAPPDVTPLSQRDDGVTHAPVTPAPPHPTPMVKRSSSSTSASRGADDDDDERAIAQAIETLAQRHLAARQAMPDRDPVALPDRWLSHVRRTLREDHDLAAGALLDEHPGITPAELADLLEPPGSNGETSSQSRVSAGSLQSRRAASRATTGAQRDKQRASARALGRNVAATDAGLSDDEARTYLVDQCRRSWPGDAELTAAALEAWQEATTTTEREDHR